LKIIILIFFLCLAAEAFFFFLLRAGQQHWEYKGNKIVHPALGTYRGRETDFGGNGGLAGKGLHSAILSRRLTLLVIDVRRIVRILILPWTEFAQGINDLVTEEEEAREFNRRAIEDDERGR
jgi:hypothetical protein